MDNLANKKYKYAIPKTANIKGNSLLPLHSFPFEKNEKGPLYMYKMPHIRSYRAANTLQHTSQSQLTHFFLYIHISRYMYTVPVISLKLCTHLHMPLNMLFHFQLKTAVLDLQINGYLQVTFIVYLLNIKTINSVKVRFLLQTGITNLH